jgi:hypothetical protein
MHKVRATRPRLILTKGLIVGFLNLNPFSFSFFTVLTLAYYSIIRGINPIQQALNAFFLPVIVLLSIFVGLLSDFRRHRRGGRDPASNHHR